MISRTITMAVAFVLTAANAYSATITYSTLGRFNGGAFTATPTLTAGSGSLTFTGLPPTTSVDPGFLSYGTFDANATGTGTFPAGTTFDLQVVQTTPSNGSATAAATLSGTLTATSSSVRVLFTSVAFNIGTVGYTIEQPLNGFAIVSPANNPGLTSIQGNAVIIPEPSLIGCIGIGLFLVGMNWRKRN